MPPGRKKMSNLDRIAKMNEIMDSVEKIFADANVVIPAMTMADIARQAGIAKGTVYLYFKSKDDLIMHCYLRSQRKKLEAMTQVFALHEQPEDKLRAFFYFYIDFFRRNPEYLKIQLYFENGLLYRADLPETKVIEYRSLAQQMRQSLVEVLQDCREKGILQDGVNIDIIHHILSRSTRAIIDFLLFGYTTHRLSRLGICTAEAFFDQYVESLLHGIIR